MGKTVAIVQSCYVPWKGYFDLIRASDVFVLYDDVQYTRRDWRNRNRIKTAAGPRWITIPVQVKGRFRQRICDVRVSDPGWAEKHWQSIRHWYARAPFFEDYAEPLESLFHECRELSLSEINHRVLLAMCDWFGIDTPFMQSSAFELPDDRVERLITICKQLNATRYLSGPNAKPYLDESRFADAGIEVVWMDYSGYPEYPQLYGPFMHEVSALDLLLNTGPEARRYMKSVEEPTQLRAAV